MYIKYMWSKDLSSIGVAVQEQLCKNEVDKAQLGNQVSKEHTHKISAQSVQWFMRNCGQKI